MDLITIIGRLAVPNVNKLVKQIDNDWFLNNINGDLMGINNQRFLCNYIEDNMNENTEIIKDGYIQDILHVHRLDYKNLKTPDFSKVQNLPYEYQQIYYALIGRIDSYRVNIESFLKRIELYTVIVNSIFPNYTTTPYRVYSLVRLLNGININYHGIQVLSFAYKYPQYIDIMIDYESVHPQDISTRHLAIVILLTNDLENFKALDEKTEMANAIGNSKVIVEYVPYVSDKNTLDIIRTYKSDLMALICAMGRLEFLKHLLLSEESDYRLTRVTGVRFKSDHQDNLFKMYGNNDNMPRADYLSLPNYFISETREVATYLTIALKNKQYEMANYLINNGYPIQTDTSYYYDIINDIEFSLSNQPEIKSKYVTYIQINRQFISEVDRQLMSGKFSEDILKNMITQGANPNIFCAVRDSIYITIPILYYVFPRNLGLAEILVSLGADINYKDSFGRNGPFYAHFKTEVQFCKIQGADFTVLDYLNSTAVLGLDIQGGSELALDCLKLMIKEGLNINQRDNLTYKSVAYMLAVEYGLEVVPLIKDSNLNIFDDQGLDPYGHNIRDPKMRRYIFNIGVRGIISYKKPMFYMPKKNSDCPNEETVGLIETNNSEDDTIIMFRDFGYSDTTHRHKQEPMCIAVSELNEIYFMLRPGTEEFEWNLPTTRRTHRLGRDQVEDTQVITYLVLCWVICMLTCQ